MTSRPPVSVLVLCAALALSIGTQLGYWPSALDAARGFWHNYRDGGGGGGAGGGRDGGAVRVFTREELARYTGGTPAPLPSSAKKKGTKKGEDGAEAAEGGSTAAAGEQRGGTAVETGKETTSPAATRAVRADGSPIYLAILGRVYDVTAGDAFYGPDAGGYSGFAGRDGSRAFVTGEFTAEGLVEDIDDLNDQQVSDVFQWNEFYTNEDKYHYLGKVKGLYVDAEGRDTPYFTALSDRVQAYKRKKQQEKEAKRGYPTCNSRWEQGKGSKLWCDDGRVPRKWYIDPKGAPDKYACHCFVDPEIPPTTGRIEPYKRCGGKATTCNFADGEKKE